MPYPSLVSKVGWRGEQGESASLCWPDFCFFFDVEKSNGSIMGRCGLCCGGADLGLPSKHDMRVRIGEVRIGQFGIYG